MPIDGHIHHVGLSTGQLDVMIDFYCGLFDFEVVTLSSWDRGQPQLDALVGLPDSAARYAMLRNGSARVELHEYSSPAGRPADLNRPVADHGQSHFCFGVSDIEAEYARLTAAGMRFHSAPFPAAAQAGPGDSRVAYGRDPDGNIVELLQVIGDAVEHHCGVRPASSPGTT
jgi:catechol 2,3-dioxygenase-like lactoylglutathione lyase family enzyme